MGGSAREARVLLVDPFRDSTSPSLFQRPSFAGARARTSSLQFRSTFSHVFPLLEYDRSRYFSPLMSRIACSWVDLAGNEDAENWYLNKHIPSVVDALKTTARNAEMESSETSRDMFKDVAGIERQYMTILDLPENAAARDINAHTEIARGEFPSEAKICTRVYAEYAKMHGEEWSDNVRDVQMIVVIIWQPEESIHAGFVDWLRSEYMPGVLESPEALRSTIYKLQLDLAAGKEEVNTQDTGFMHPYMTIWEFDSDELPWEVLISLSAKEGWRHFVDGGQVQWQIGMYLVNRVYPEQEDKLQE